ncbi:MAG: undecaprenyl-diphosphate phosphatase [Alcanivoracaceae bacterium]|nr:undecaprenyl-diphosphate phosphatase [Alcanivoracaceae bacterium]
MDSVQAFWLALVQGITEFLPISSSAHLILPSQVLGWPDQGLAFDVAVHLGTLSAVVAYYRRDVGAMASGSVRALLQRRLNEQAGLAVLVVLATIPAVLAGFLFKDSIETQLRSTMVIVVTTLVFGVLLGVADVAGKRRLPLAQLGLRDALVVGFAQALALIPGTSRSGITMTAALLMGYQREAAARFSFLLSIPVILGAATLKLSDLVAQAEPVPWSQLAVGFVTAALTAYLTIVVFLRVLERLGMWPWVAYRLMLGAVLLWLTLSA